MDDRMPGRRRAVHTAHAHRKVPNVRLGETETHSQNTVTTPRSVQRVGDTESRKKRNI